MANTINTNKSAPGIIAKAAAGIFEENLQFCKTIDKADTSDFQGKNGYSAGDTIQISKPDRAIPNTSFDITSSIEDFKEEKTPLALDIVRSIGKEFTSQQIAHDIALKNFITRVVEPNVTTLAQYVEKDHLEKAVDATQNLVGTAGSTVFNTNLSLQAQQKINENACPDLGNRFFLLNSAATTSAVDARKGLFQSSEEIAKQYKNGYMGMADGFTYLTNNLLPTHTNGNDVTGVAIDATPAEAATSVNMDGFTANTGTITKGSVFTIDGVNAVHPVTKEDLGYAQQFVVTADGTADANGDIVVSFYPALYSSTSGALQNISALPSDNDAITFIGSASTGYVQNIAYHKNAFRMASVPLHLPSNAELAIQETVDDVTLQVVRDFDILTRKEIIRFDYLGGLAAVRPEWACRATS